MANTAVRPVLESGRHTDPTSGKSYHTLAVWKPEAPHANYIHDDELNEKYKAIAPERARDWWTEKHATIPPIVTLETHIIGGAIIPLWQRLKTNEDARLRVVRVTTEEGQRIVGIQIPPDNVGTVLRSLGLSRDLREPEEIFYAVLDEGEEMTLASNLKLRRGSIHSEPAIELCGADPYKFAELRELGLINEQINWKQRFFVPSDETSGIDILTSLLDRYPVIAADESDRGMEPDITATVSAPEIAPSNFVDLDQWIIAVDKADSADETANEVEHLQASPESTPEDVDSTKPDDRASFVLTQQVASVSWTQLAQRSSEIQLAFEFS